MLRLPRNLHINRQYPADARAYIRPLGQQQSAVPASAAPATKSAHQAPVPSRRQGVHPTPWQAASTARKCYRQSAGAQLTPGRTSDLLAGSKVLCLPRNLHIKVHKVLRVPRNLHINCRCPADARACIRPLGRQQSAAPATKSAYEGSQSAAPATKSAHPTPGRTCDPLASGKVLRLQVLRLPPRAHIRPRGKQQAPHTVHMEVHKVLCLPRDLRTEVHKVLRRPRNLHVKVHKVLRLPRNLHIKRRCPADARAYIRPLGRQQSAAPATKSACEGSQSAAPATKSAYQAPVPSRRQGVHPTPRPAAKCCACKCCACHEICTSSAGAQQKEQEPHTKMW